MWALPALKAELCSTTPSPAAGAGRGSQMEGKPGALAYAAAGALNYQLHFEGVWYSIERYMVLLLLGQKLSGPFVTKPWIIKISIWAMAGQELPWCMKDSFSK